MRKGLIKLFTSVTIAALLVTLFPYAIINALSGTNEISLVTATSDGSLMASLKCGTVDILKEENPTITYGDQLACDIDWAFPNTFKLTTDDILVYNLPSVISFEQKTGDIWDGSKDIGDYEITGSKIRMNYTDPVFCAQESRVGHLSFKGSVEKSPAGGQDPVDVQLIFEGVADLTVHLEPKPVVAALEIDKVFKLEDSDTHVYSCWISINATGDQTNVSVVDTMWPGMDLYNGVMPKIYYDLNGNTEFTDYSGFAFEAGDGRTFSTNINNLKDGETVYVLYKVQVRDEMYDAALGQQYVESNGYTENDSYYPYGYDGVVPNRVTVSSEQVTKPVQKTTDIYASGYSFVKWRAKEIGDEFTFGIVRWQLYINAIDANSAVTEGYIIDTLPVNFSYIDDSTTMYNDDTYGGLDVDQMLNITTYVDDQGNNVIKYEFTSEMIEQLKTVKNGIMIEYKTHIDAHTDDSTKYENTASLYYNGALDSTKVADFYYTAPPEVAKSGEYDSTTAPYANYVIRVNPAALDLDPNSSTITLTDTMGSALDLVTGSVVVKDGDGNIVPITVDYDPGTHTFSLTLNDNTFYEVTYSAIVNLVPGATLDDTNAVNTCALTCVVPTGDDGDFVIKSTVYNNSASSSSIAGTATVNIIKHDDDSYADTLAGAEFTVQSLTVDANNNVTSAADLTSGTTGADGRISVNGIVRGTYYMFTETKAPAGYELDSTPKFVVFAVDDTTAYASKLTYNGVSYDVEKISYDKAFFDLYIANSESVMAAPPSSVQPTTPDPAAPADPAAPVAEATVQEEIAAPTTTPDPVSAPTPADTLVAGAATAKEVPATGEEGNTMAIAGALMIASAAITVAICARKAKKEE